MTTLFEQLGGQKVVDAIVDRFYHIVLDDDRLKHFFADVDMVEQRNHQKRFVAVALSGANSLTGSLMMREGHQHLVENMGLSDAHFDAFVGDLTRAMSDFGVSAELIAKVGVVLETTREDVLNR